MRGLRLFCLLAVLGVGLIFSPALAAPASRDQPANLVILTYNVLYNNIDLAAISEIIRASNADVVLIQEVTADLARDLPPLLEDAYPYAAMRVAIVRRLGLGVFSRYPLLIEAFRRDISLDSSSLYVQIDLDGTPITIYNVHLANPLNDGFRYDASQPSQSVSWLLDLLSLDQTEQPMPLIVAGDLNFANFSADYSRMTEYLTDSFAETSGALQFGFTFPADALFPLLRLDYVFHNAAFCSRSAAVGESAGGSDHYPLRVELNLVEQTP